MSKFTLLSLVPHQKIFHSVTTTGYSELLLLRTLPLIVLVSEGNFTVSASVIGMG